LFLNTKPFYIYIYIYIFIVPLIYLYLHIKHLLKLVPEN
jgi:hypothetical protein